MRRGESVPRGWFEDVLCEEDFSHLCSVHEGDNKVQGLNDFRFSQCKFQTPECLELFLLEEAFDVANDHIPPVGSTLSNIVPFHVFTKDTFSQTTTAKSRIQDLQHFIQGLGG